MNRYHPRRIRLRWPELGRSVQADLMESTNPALAKEVSENLPLISIQSHAVIAGEQMYFPTRIVLQNLGTASTEPMNSQPVGRVNFEPFFQYISMNYGPISEAVPAWPIAQVDEDDVASLKEIGGQVLHNLLYSNDFLHVILEDPDSRETTIPSEPQTSGSSLDIPEDLTWRELVSHLEEQTAAIWLTEPADVRALRSGILAEDAGVGDQYFSPWVMAAGLVRSLAITDLSTLVRLCEDDAFDLIQLRKVFYEVLALPVDVIGYFGLPILESSLRAAERVSPQIGDRDQYCHFLRKLMSYVNRYNLWLHQTFPWSLGLLYPKFDPERASTALDLASRPTFMSNPADTVDVGRKEAGKETP